MDAQKIFNELIYNIENSKLNYIISKTPFSAQISIKRSFIKSFDTPSQIPAVAKIKQDPQDLSKEVTEQLVSDQKRGELLKNERLKVKSLEDQIVVLREELLKVKSEKNETKTKLKKHENVMHDLQQQAIKIKQENKDLESDLTEKGKALKAKETECKMLRKEKPKLKKGSTSLCWN